MQIDEAVEKLKALKLELGDEPAAGGKLILKTAKGQLISKCPFGVIVWTKIPTKNLTNFCPRI